MGTAELAERPDAPEEETRPYVLFAADRVFRVVIEALAHIEDWEPWPPFSRGYHVDLSPTFSLTVGARGLTLAEGDEIWHRLRRAPDLAIKLQFALWAAYLEGDENPTARTWTSLGSVLARLGYAPHPSGGYKTRDLQLVSDTLRAVFGLAASGRWSDSGQQKEHSLTGALWQEGLVATERHEGARGNMWIAYQPGQWFADPAWRTRNAFVGRVAATLLTLDTRKDRWTIRVGSAYAWLARANLLAGPIHTLRVRALAEQTGAAAVYHGRPGQLRAHIEAACDHLLSMGLLGEWEWRPGPAGIAGGWLEGSIRAEWIDAIPPPTCSDTTPHVLWDHPSRVISEIKNRPNRCNTSKGRPLTFRAGAASSLSAGRGLAREVGV
ncbi:MAG: hypothetical protein ACYDEA_09410 [Candidatus Dormibacteria bacterium]